MSSVVLRLIHACNHACAFCNVTADLDGRPVQARQIKAAIDQAVDKGHQEVVFSGGEATLSAHLVKAIAYARGRGLRTRLVTNGRILSDDEKVKRLVAVGLHAVTVSLHTLDPATHARLVSPDTVSFTQVQASLPLLAARFPLTVRVVLTTRNVHEIPAIIDRAAELGARMELRRVWPLGAAADQPTLDLSDDDALATLEAALRHAGNAGVPLAFQGFGGEVPGPPPNEPGTLDPVLWHMLSKGVLPPALRAGVAPLPLTGLKQLAEHAGLAPASLALSLADRGVPLRQLAPALGGTGTDTLDAAPAVAWPAQRPAAGAIHVVAGRTGGAWMLGSVLPALVHHLTEQGHDATLHTLWSTPFDPDTRHPKASVLGRVTRGLRRAVRRKDAPPTLGELADPERDASQDEAVEAAWLASLPLDDAAVLVVPDLATASRLRARRGLAAEVRVHAVDGEMLAGFDGTLGAHDVVRTPTPSLRAPYAALGVHAWQRLPRPLPVHRPHLPEAPAAATCSGLVLVGGSDLDLELARAVWPDRPVVALDAPEGLGEPGPAHPMQSGLDEALALLAGARAVWAPVHRRRGRAPSLWWPTLALALGRPVVATYTAGLKELVVHQHTGLLVRGGDPPAMRAALDALADDALVARLGEAAAARAATHDVAAWASELVTGAAEARVVRGPDHRPRSW